MAGESMIRKWLPRISLACAAIGLLLITETIRPFHDMRKDGPLAMVCWALGLAAAVASLFTGGRTASAIMGLIFNAVPLIGVALLLLALKHSTLIWH